MNTELLLKVKAAILEEPKRLDMSDWAMSEFDMKLLPEDIQPPCNTVACIAGWAISIHNNIFGEELYTLVKSKPAQYAAEGVYDHYHFGPHFEAKGLLELTEEQADSLFYREYWPLQFRAPYTNAAQGSILRAKLAADRIDHFIATGE